MSQPVASVTPQGGVPLAVVGDLSFAERIALSSSSDNSIAWDRRMDSPLLRTTVWIRSLDRPCIKQAKWLIKPMAP